MPLRRRLRLYAAYGPLLILLLLWLWLFYAEGAVRGGPNGKSFGADYAMFLTAAQISRDGGNPYDRHLLYKEEASYLRARHLSIVDRGDIVRVGNPPQMFWALRGLTKFPFQATAVAWMLGLYILSGIGFLMLLKYLGWRRWPIPLVFFLLMPQTVFGPFYGNVISLVFLGIAASLALMRRYPAWAGACLTLAWLKPPVALPIVLVVLLFHAPRWKLTFAAFVASSIAFFGFALPSSGIGSLSAWLHALVGYSNDISSSPDIASLAGLYARSLSGNPRLVVEILSLGIALSCTAAAWKWYRYTGEVSIQRVAWLWLVWFIASPYAHFFDEVLLCIPIAASLGIDAWSANRPQAILMLYVLVLSLIVISAAPHGVQLLWIPLVTILLCLVSLKRGPELQIA